MSGQDSNQQQELRNDNILDKAESQTAAAAGESTQAHPFAAATAATAATSTVTAVTAVTPPNGGPAAKNSPLSGVDVQKLLELLKNPSSALKLQPQTEWIYGVVGAAVGVLGFFFWIWAIQQSIDNLLGGLGNLILYSLLGVTSPGKYLVIGIFSISLLVGSLTLVGNWLGARKRDWMEAVTFQGSTQLLFGAGWIVSGIVAFLSIQLSMLLGMILLLINLLLVVNQAEDLHEVSRERRFLFIVYSTAAYMLLLFLVYSVIT